MRLYRDLADLELGRHLLVQHPETTSAITCWTHAGAGALDAVADLPGGNVRRGRHRIPPEATAHADTDRGVDVTLGIDNDTAPT